MGEEKRKNVRLPIQLELNISSLFKQDNIVISNINECIEVSDVSKSGLGFYCTQELPVGYYFDAKIQLPNKHFLTVIKILRSVKFEDKYRIGCEFVGLSSILSKSVDEYAHELHNS